MNKKLYLFLLGSLLVLGFFLLVRNFLRSAPTSVSVADTKTQTLPSTWIEVPTSDANIKKYEKKVSSGLTPQIVVIVSDLPQNTKPKEYVDQLIAGAKSTIPSLRIKEMSSVSPSDISFGRNIFGTYQNGRNLVLIRQRILVVKDKVYTFTASYDSKNDTDRDIESIFNQVASLILPN